MIFFTKKNIRLTRIFFFQEILKKSIVKSKYKNQISVRDKASKHPKIIAIKIASFSTHFSLMNRKFPFNKILNGRPVRVQTHGKNTTMEEISVRGGSWWLERRREKKKKKKERERKIKMRGRSLPWIKFDPRILKPQAFVLVVVLACMRWTAMRRI